MAWGWGYQTTSLSVLGATKVWVIAVPILYLLITYWGAFTLPCFCMYACCCLCAACFPQCHFWRGYCPLVAVSVVFFWTGCLPEVSWLLVHPNNNQLCVNLNALWICIVSCYSQLYVSYSDPSGFWGPLRKIPKSPFQKKLWTLVFYLLFWRGSNWSVTLVSLRWIVVSNWLVATWSSY